MKAMIDIGNRIELTQVASATRRKLSENKYGSQLLDYDGIRTAKISMPMVGSRLVPLEVGDQYQLCFFTNSGMYQCKARIDKRFAEGKTYVLKVLFLTELKKYQRRKFYRLDCMFPVKFRVISNVEMIFREKLEKDQFASPEERENCEQEIEKLPKDWRDGTVSDLSGGGIRFHGNMEVEKGASLEIMLPLSFQSGIVPVKFLTKVVGCAYFESSRVAYEVRGEFEKLSDAEREIVVKYVFEEQRRRMRKE